MLVRQPRSSGCRSCQRSFLDRNMSSRLTNRGQSLWIRYRLLSHSLLFPIDFGDSHVFSKIQELEVKRKLSSLLDFNRCRNFPYLFRTGRPRRNNRLVYNIIAVDQPRSINNKNGTVFVLTYINLTSINYACSWTAPHHSFYYLHSTHYRYISTYPPVLLRKEKQR